MFSQSRSRGLSLLELLLAFSILAIISTLAAPGLQQLYQRAMARHSSNQLVNALQLARATAVNYRRVATLCPSRDGDACSRQWALQLMVFLDNNENGRREPEEQIIKLLDGPPEGGRLHWAAFRNPRVYIQYQADGSTRHNGTFTYCPADGSDHNIRRIIINRPGRVRFGLPSEAKRNPCLNTS
ncbi:MAG: GspH/FimT family pseudopilin [Cellvibrionaceae bacterium]|nr:GspH/FimT family pseudopilin [Cellvibrionaceae bacterium]